MTIIVNGSNTPTAGAVGYGDGTNLAFTSSGTTGQFLQSNGSSAPSWVGAPSSAMTLISTQTANNSSQLIQWTGLSGYNSYLIILKNLTPSSNDAYQLLIGTGAGPTYITTGYNWNGLYNYNGGSVSSLNSSNQAKIFFAGAFNNNVASSGGGASGNIMIQNPSSGYLVAQCQTTFFTGTSNVYESDLIYGSISSANTITAIKIQTTNGANLASGTASLYGISS